MKNISKITIILLAFIVIGCSSDSNPKPNPETETFNIKQLLSDNVDNVIIPLVESFANTMNTLETETNLYVSNPTESQLVQIQNKWKIASQQYEKIYLFNIGVIRDRFTHLNVYNWPTTSNAIENLISTTEITEDVVENLGSQSKSLASIEYLLFNTSISNTNTDFVTSENRRNLLKFTVSKLKQEAVKIENTWSVNGENFAETFINSNETGIDNSFNKLYNGIYNAIDTDKVTKVGKPAGLENSQILSPDLVQAPYSKTSLQLLKSSIESVENTYFNNNGLSISDYVKFITKDDVLNNAVQNKINEIYTTINSIPNNLFEAITDNHSQVEQLHSELEELGILFSVDVRSTLSIIITTTDNDGD